MEGAPLSIDPQAVGKALAGVPGVTAVHDLHLWRIVLASTTPLAARADDALGALG